MPKIIESSAEIIDQTDGDEETGELFCTERYPWRVLDINQSFLVEGKTLGKMQMLAEKAMIKYGRNFVVIEREDGTVEVGRVGKNNSSVSFQIFEASREGRSRVLTMYDEFGLQPDTGARPWNMLPLGHCFIIKADLSASRSIRAAAANQNRRSGKKYSVVHHNHDGIFEVVRII